MTVPLYAVFAISAAILALTVLAAALIGLLVGNRGSTSTPAAAGDVIQRLGELKGAVEQLKEINREANNDTRKLQETLTHPKHRGMLGERLLEAVLGNVLPPGMFSRQYAFANGEVVDAAIFIDKKVVPVDAKFPLENYNRWAEAPDGERTTYEKAFINDLKQRIDETAKYIRPTERTMDFAFMYIPAEGIYYDLLTNRVGGDSLIQYAAAKRVIIVSPASLLAYLQTVMQGDVTPENSSRRT